jgi:MBG domain (YGX type)
MKALSLKGIISASVMLITLLGGLRTATAQVNNSIFGPNVWIIDPTMPIDAVNTALNSKAISGTSQFGTAHAAVFFMPGAYSVTAKIGFNEAVYGLGANPTGVTINGYITPNYSGAVSTNMTTVFWRSMANLTFNPGYNASQNNPPNTLQWGVSQGTSLRRLQVNGNLQMDGSALLPGGTICGWASGGFVADIVVTGYMDPCAQQQWYTRNSELGSWDDVLNVWNQGHIDNMVFSGVVGAPPQTFALADPRTVPDNTVLDTTPRSREMPFIYVDSSQNFNVFVPTLRTSSRGSTWSNGGQGYGYSLPISAFFIATPTSTLDQINAALASGQNLILTPGIYTYSGSINVTNPNTVILGLGYADLVSETGTPVITIADVDGVQVGGLLIDATTANAAVLLQVGTPGAPRVSHAANPTTLADIFVRVGGYVKGTATTSLEVDSDDVILDNLWLWRADHGAGAGWTSNLAAHGLVVNGDNVLATGLAVEHYQQNQVVWNGNGGETIFFQDEAPYDVPSQAGWMNGTARGFSPYSVSPGVSTHKAYGLGIYSNFTSAPVILDSAITVPVAPGVTVTDALTYNLSSLVGSGIAHVVNDQGVSVGPGGNNTAYLPFYGVTPLTVTANNATKAVGAAIPPFTASYSGFVNGDTTAVLSGSPAFSTTATSSSPAGVYPITATQGTLAAANNFPYTFNFVSGTLSVIAAPTIVLNTSATLTGSASAGYTATVTVSNTGTGSASNVVLTAATLGTVTGSVLPQSLGSIPAGGHVIATVTFSGAAGADGAGVVEKYTGTYTGGTITGSIRAVLP